MKTRITNVHSDTFSVTYTVPMGIERAIASIINFDTPLTKGATVMLQQIEDGKITKEYREYGR